MSRSELEALYVPLREVTRLPPMRWQPPRKFPRVSRLGMFTCGILGTLLILLHASYYYWFTIDDAFITFRYAENLVHHGVLQFNPGERVEGYSNLLWTLQNAFGIALHLHPLKFSRALAIASWLALLWWGLYMVRSSARRMRTGAAPEYLAQACLAWLVAASPVLALHSQSGLETVQNAFWLALAFGAAVFAGQTGKHKWGITAATGLALAILSRPENFGFLPLWVIALLMQRRDWRGNFSKHKWSLLAPFATLALLLTWRMLAYGAPLPVTVTAKGALAGGLPALRRGAMYLLTFFQSQMPPYPFLTLLIASALLLAFLPGLGWSWRLTRMAFGFMLLALGNAFFAIWVGGDFMQNARLLAPLVLPCALALAWGVLVFAEHSQKTDKLGFAPRLLAVFLIVCCGAIGVSEFRMSLFTLDYGSLRTDRLEKTDVHNAIWTGLVQDRIVKSIPFYNVYTSALVPLAVEQIGPGQSLFVSDIGIVGDVMLNVRIIDGAGLVTPPFANFLRENAGSTPSTQSIAKVIAYLDAAKPDWLWLYDRGKPDLTTGLTAGQWPAFARDYEQFGSIDEYTGMFQLSAGRRIGIYRRKGTHPLPVTAIDANYARLGQVMWGDKDVTNLLANWQRRRAMYIPFSVEGVSPVLPQLNRVQAQGRMLQGTRFLGRFDGIDASDGWTMHGLAFQQEPRIDAIFGQQPASGFFGIGYLNSFHPAEREAARGYAESPPLRPNPGDHLLFWLAGGTSPQTGVDLLVDGNRQLHWSGYGHNRLTPLFADLTPFAGRQVTLQVIDSDKETGGWVTADQFVILDPHSP